MYVAKRWQPLFSLLVMLVLVLLAVQPAGARPQAVTRTGAPQPIAGKHGMSLRTGRTAAPLRDLAARAKAAGPIRDGRNINGTPYQGFDESGQPYTYYDLHQNLQVPHGTLSRQFNSPRTSGLRPQPEAGRPNTPPLKKIIDDPMPALDAFWEGLNQGSNRTNFTFGFLPPDTNGDTSGNVYDNGFYVQTVNANFAIWDYSQVNVYGAWPKTVVPPTPINVLFSGFGGACEATNDGDPVVLYDEQAERWLISQFALPYWDFETNPFPDPFYQCIAISETDDPTGGWFLYEFGGLFQDLNDYPKIGVWNDGYYMTVNQFGKDFPYPWEGQGVMVFERDAMLLGNPAQWVYFDPYTQCTGSEPECFLGNMLPADTDGTFAPAGTPGYVIEFDDDAWGYSGDQLQIWTVDVDWVTPANSIMAHDVDLPVNAFDSAVCPGYPRSCIPQPGTTVGLDAISDRLMYRLQFRNFGDHQTIVANHTVKEGAGQAGVRWYELRDTGSGWSVYQQGDFAPDTSNRWMGSIAMDAVGNMALGYSVSSSSVYPSIRYAGRLASDPLNTLPRTEVQIATGGGSQTSDTSRWGDYSSMSVAPDGCSFVYTNEYLRGTTPAEWYTRMGNFHFEACTQNDVTPPDTTITDQPTNPSTGAVTFAFTGDDGGGSGVDHFLCSLDGSAFDTCTSPKSYTGLASGSHTFQVAAVDVVGNVDPTPASYTWMVVNPVAAFRSAGGQDGWVLESSELSGLGGTLDAAAATFRLGDETGDRQYRSILSFDTSTLPDTAVITKVTLKIRKQGLVGTDPFSLLQKLYVDIRKGHFSTSAALQLQDFNAASSLNGAGIVPNTPVAGLYSSNLGRLAFPFVNRTGGTQLRLRFQRDDNDDLSADYMRFYSGNVALATLRPVLIVEYYVP